MLIPYGYLVAFISSLGAIPTLYGVGGLSFSGAATFGIGLVSLALVILRLNHIPRGVVIVLPLLLFCLFDLFGTPFSDVHKGSIQETVVWFGSSFIFIATYCLSRGLWNTKKEHQLHKVFLLCSNIVLVVMLLSYLQLLPGVKDDSSTPAVGLIFFCYRAARYFVTKERSSLSWIIIAISLSILMVARMVVISEIMVLFVGLYLTGMSTKNLLLGGLFVVIVLTSISIFGDRFVSAFTTGDNALRYGGVNINTTGRGHAWQLMVESIAEAPWFGHGTDMPETFSGVERWAHPHNDYLRILHHLGIVGMVLWFSFFYRVWRRISRVRTISGLSSSDRVFGFSALLSIVGFSLMMLTDNVIVYMYVIYPVMMMMALGSAVIERASASGDLPAIAGPDVGLI